MTNKIQVMKDMLANKIAAGEIIERPLSVVKELVENSIDADSKKIEIKLKSSGLMRIEIIDNGHGMNKEDLEMSIKRHATSKIYDDKDLFKISTLGFRGEAIPSIFSVSKMTISSSLDGISGYSLVKDGEEEYKITTTSLNVGTQVIVENLFYNTPVRYKHLSSPFYELSLILQYINKISLIRNDISFKLYNDNNLLINTKGDSNPIDIISNQYNYEIANKLLTKTNSNEHFKIEIFTSHPEHTRSRKNHITIGINKRLIRNYDIENQIIKSYGHLLHTNQFPITFLNIEVKYELVDVNVHPTKQQIKLSMQTELLELIDETIAKLLNEISYISEPNEIITNSVAEVSDEYEVNEILDNTFKSKKAEEKAKEQVEEKEIEKAKEQVKAVSDDQFGQKEIAKINSNNVDYTEELFTYKEDRRTFNKIPNFDYIGTYENTYLLFQNEEGLYLVDQHAAQERINYEKIYDKFSQKSFVYQNMLLPVVVELSNFDNEIFKHKFQLIENFGIVIEPFGVNTYKVIEADSFISSRETFALDIHEIIQLIIAEKSEDFAKYYEEVAISMACKKSIKANQYLNKAESLELMKELDKASSPFTCPHGRPVIVNITKREISKMFKRVM